MLPYSVAEPHPIGGQGDEIIPSFDLHLLPVLAT
jgi:hypothetical protein